jgi:hypothetical protein
MAIVCAWGAFLLVVDKNLLDLLGQRRPSINWPLRHLLYKDDHGEEHPAIIAEQAAGPGTATT